MRARLAPASPPLCRGPRLCRLRVRAPPAGPVWTWLRGFPARCLASLLPCAPPHPALTRTALCGLTLSLPDRPHPSGATGTRASVCLPVPRTSVTVRLVCSSLGGGAGPSETRDKRLSLCFPSSWKEATSSRRSGESGSPTRGTGPQDGLGLAGRAPGRSRCRGPCAGRGCLLPGTAGWRRQPGLPFCPPVGPPHFPPRVRQHCRGAGAQWPGLAGRALPCSHGRRRATRWSRP